MTEELESVIDVTPTESVVDSQEVEQTEQSTPETSVEVEVAEPQQEKPVQSKEENAQYAQVRRDAEAKTRDKMISEMYGASHNIHTYSDYQKAMEQQAEQKRKEELAEKGIDPSVFDEYINNNPTVKESREIIAQQKAQQKRNDEYGEFLEYFKVENGRDFNSATDQISPEVWEMTTKGKSLTDAFAFSTTKVLKAKIAEYEAKFKAQETNENNANSSPGSVTGNGAIKDTTLTPEMIDSMTDQQRMARWPEIKKVLGMK